MKSGQGRLILRDGTDLPIGYRLAHNEFDSWCSGTLIGNIRSIDPGNFAQGMKVELDLGERFAALVTGHSERHLSFVAKAVVGTALPRDDDRHDDRAERKPTG